MALINDYDLTQDGIFLHRAQMALVSTALTVQAESVATANHAARSAFAMAILNNPEGYARLMAPGLTTDGNIISTATDAALEVRAAAIFNAYCVGS